MIAFISAQKIICKDVILKDGGREAKPPRVCLLAIRRERLGFGRSCLPQRPHAM
jgi:hypothetical protein